MVLKTATSPGPLDTRNCYKLFSTWPNKIAYTSRPLPLTDLVIMHSILPIDHGWLLALGEQLSRSSCCLAQYNCFYYGLQVGDPRGIGSSYTHSSRPLLYLITRIRRKPDYLYWARAWLLTMGEKWSRNPCNMIFSLWFVGRRPESDWE